MVLCNLSVLKATSQLKVGHFLTTYITSSKYITGLLKDIYLTYEYSFYLGGAAMLASGVCVALPLRHILAKEAEEARKAEKYLAVNQLKEEDLKDPAPA